MSWSAGGPGRFGMPGPSKSQAERGSNSNVVQDGLAMVWSILFCFPKPWLREQEQRHAMQLTLQLHPDCSYNLTSTRTEAVAAWLLK